MESVKTASLLVCCSEGRRSVVMTGERLDGRVGCEAVVSEDQVATDPLNASGVRLD